MGGLNLTVAAWDDRIFSVALDGGESLETLKAVLEAESGVPAAQQRLLLNGKPLSAAGAASAATTLASAGLSDGDMLMLLPPEAPAGARGGGAGGAGGAAAGAASGPEAELREAIALGPDGRALRPAAFIQAARRAPALLSQLERAFPPVADAVRAEDPAALQAALSKLRSLQEEERERQRAEDALLDADPFDAEAQAKIEALIRRKNVEESYEQAMEHAPEMFAPVTMLYCHMEVNGVPVKAFIDSGAQMTIMTEDFARRCHLERLLDTRFHGTAVGVGSSRILGRVHAAPMKVSGHFITSSITVLEQKSGPQFIFGLDMLKRHRCRLDFAPDARAGAGDDGVVVSGPHLYFGSCGVALPFLGDAEIPRDFAHDALEERSEEAAAKSMSQAVGAPGGKEDGGAAGASGAAAAPAASGGAAAAAASGAAAKPAASGGGAPPAAAAAPTASGAAAAGAAGGDDKVSRLMALGFPRGVCEEALSAAAGNEDAAAAMLFGGLDG